VIGYTLPVYVHFVQIQQASGAGVSYLTYCIFSTLALFCLKSAKKSTLSPLPQNGKIKSGVNLAPGLNE